MLSRRVNNTAILLNSLLSSNSNSCCHVELRDAHRILSTIWLSAFSQKKRKNKWNIGMSEAIIPYIHPVAVITMFNSREMSREWRNAIQFTEHNIPICVCSDYALDPVSNCRTQKYSDKANHQGNCTGFQVCISLHLVNRTADSVNETVSWKSNACSACKFLLLWILKYHCCIPILRMIFSIDVNISHAYVEVSEVGSTLQVKCALHITLTINRHLSSSWNFFNYPEQALKLGLYWMEKGQYKFNSTFSILKLSAKLIKCFWRRYLYSRRANRYYLLITCLLYEQTGVK